jgi:hypothetical protein
MKSRSTAQDCKAAGEYITHGRCHALPSVPLEGAQPRSCTRHAIRHAVLTAMPACLPAGAFLTPPLHMMYTWPPVERYACWTSTRQAVRPPRCCSPGKSCCRSWHNTPSAPRQQSRSHLAHWRHTGLRLKLAHSLLRRPRSCKKAQAGRCSRGRPRQQRASRTAVAATRQPALLPWPQLLSRVLT